MFTAADFKLIQRICPTDLLQLLNLLGIDRQKMNFTGEDEFEKYADLDEEIDAKISAKLKSNSVLEGYTKLLDAGRIDFKLSETRIELLKKILANREKIQSPNSYGTLNKDFKLTFNIAERSNFTREDFSKIPTFIKNLTENFSLSEIPEKIPLIARKKELPVSISTVSKIKKILKEELNLNGIDIDEISVSIIGNSNADKPAPLPNKKYDDIFNTLEQVNKIFDKI